MAKVDKEAFMAAWKEIVGGEDAAATGEQMKQIRDKLGVTPPPERLAKLEALLEEKGGKVTLTDLQSLGPPPSDD